MKKVLIIAPFTILPGEPGENRFKYLCNLLAKEGMQVELMTSSFYHPTKVHRDINSDDYSNNQFKITFIHEPGYKKNVSVARLFSQSVFADNLKATLKTLEYCPDVIYCAIPIPNAAVVAGGFAKSRGIPFVIDVQDIWPEAMRLIINIPVVSSIGLAPMKKKADTAYSMADALVAVSETYLNRALMVNRHSHHNLTVFLGTDLDYFDSVSSERLDSVTKPDDEFWVTYIGSLGHSYDIETLIMAVKLLNKNVCSNIRLMVLGTGPLKERFEVFAYEQGVDAVFTGFLDYSVMAAYLRKSDVAVNAIRRKAVQSIVNKLGDYLTAGLPVLNGSLNPEVSNMVIEAAIGLNYEPENPESLARKLELLYHDGALRLMLGCNARALAEKRFDRKKTYTKIVEMLRDM